MSARTSTEISQAPGIAFDAPGSTAIRPTLAVIPAPARAMSRSPRTARAAPARASRRTSIGVVPAWFAWPTKRARRADQADDRGHHADVRARPLEDRALLDVQLQVRAHPVDPARLARAVGVAVPGGHGVAERRARGVTPLGQAA